jgi:hypothetical protein
VVKPLGFDDSRWLEWVDWIHSTVHDLAIRSGVGLLVRKVIFWGTVCLIGS